MSQREARRAADSAPSKRDFDAEIKALLAKADEARAAADEIDVESAMEATLSRAGAMADEAIARGEAAAEDTLDKIHVQQERFKASVVADGLSLDDDHGIYIGSKGGAGRVEDAAPAHGNKYSLLMGRRQHLQEQERNAQ